MRFILALVACVLATSALAQQKGPPTQEEILARTREAYRTAKTKQAREGVQMWCTDSIKSLNFRETEKLMLEAVKFMEADDLEEANIRLTRVNQIKDISANLAKMVCRPD
jgi:hypothetical protein